MTKYYVDIETMETTDGSITFVREIVEVEKRPIPDLHRWTIEEQQPMRIGNPKSFAEDMRELEELIKNS